MGQYAFGNGFYDTGVYADELFAGHARFAGNTRGNDNDVRAGSFGVIIGNTVDFGVESEQGCSLHHVESFTFGYTFFNIKQYDFVSNFIESQNIGTCCAYISGAYDCDFCHDLLKLKGYTIFFTCFQKPIFLLYKGIADFLLWKIFSI